MDVAKAFGVVLRSKRKKADISQEKLAHIAALDRSYVSLLERGLRGPTINTLLIIASALNIDPIDFLKDVLAKMEEI